jgi:NADPH-dependent 2,4-dienoyl-CoA reductase/sulfur reductase-like enzyme
MRASPHLDFAGEVRSLTKIPLLHAARINDVATARHAIAEGKLDLVGMTRAHIADPHIIRKIAEGRDRDIRPCVGATYCLDRLADGLDTLCIQNPATSREATMPHIVPKADGRPKHVAVVGACPGGLEAARVAGERLVDQVIVENGTAPLADLYFGLKELSQNRGDVDYEALAAGRPQNIASNPAGRFVLFRIGDAVASRNIHAAIYDALRLVKDL